MRSDDELDRMASTVRLTGVAVSHMTEEDWAALDRDGQVDVDIPTDLKFVQPRHRASGVLFHID